MTTFCSTDSAGKVRARFTTVRFVPETTALLVGDEAGRVHIASYTHLTRCSSPSLTT